jgi:hypothetical protein
LAFPVGDGFGYLELTHRHRPGRGGLGVVVEWVRWKQVWGYDLWGTQRP